MKTKEQIRDAEEKRLEKATKLKNRLSMMKKEQEAADTFMKIIIWFKYKWINMIIFPITLILTMTYLGIIARPIWEIWKIIFGLSL